MWYLKRELHSSVQSLSPSSVRCVELLHHTTQVHRELQLIVCGGVPLLLFPHYPCLHLLVRFVQCLITAAQPQTEAHTVFILFYPTVL